MPTCDNISQHSFKTTEINAPCVFEVVRHPLDARVPQLWVDTLQVTQTLAIEFYVRKRQWELSSLESYKENKIQTYVNIPFPTYISRIFILKLRYTIKNAL